MNETKPWWLSRTIWVGLATTVFAVLSGLGMVPAALEYGIIEEAVLAILGVLTVIFRADDKMEIKPILPVMNVPTE